MAHADQPGGELANAGFVADDEDAPPAGVFLELTRQGRRRGARHSASTLTIAGRGLNAAATISAVCRVRTSGLVSTTSIVTPRRTSPRADRRKRDIP
jgi:hypothetical protein